MDMPHDPSCPFCRIIAEEADAHVVYRDDVAVAFLDARPVFPGHVLVVPRAHFRTLADVPAELLGPLFAAVQRIAVAVPAAMQAQGSFVAENNVVSQSVPHLHVHVVPRTKGDGLKGFFWPRHKYEDDAQAALVAEAIRRELDG